MKSFRIISLALIAIAITGCDAFLNVESASRLSTDNFYQTPSQIDQALTGVYGALKPFAKYYFGMAEMRSDNMFEIAEAKQYDIADCAQFNTSSLMGNNYVKTCWADHYTLIAAANVLLDRIDGVEFTDSLYYKQYVAETRFLRALSYFDLVRFYGRVPISLHELSTAEAFTLGQSEPLQVYEQAIVPDLLYAVEHLQMQPVNYKGQFEPGRATRIAAEALLGKVYMQMAGYPLYVADAAEQAKIYLKRAIDHAEETGTYWAPDIDAWNRMWIHENDNTRFLFEIQYACAAGQGNPMTPLCRTSNTASDDYCGANLTVGQHFYVERDLQERMMQGTIDSITGALIPDDHRFKWTVNTALVYDEETGTYTGGATDANNILVKMFEHKIKRAALGYTDMDASLVNYTYWPQNFPVLRLEDIMLLYAECVGMTDGTDYLNRIRTRAGLPPVSVSSEEDFQQAVALERRFELLGEGHRWFDEVRHNTFVADAKQKFYHYRDKRDAAHSAAYTIYATRVTQDAALYPIPLSQIQVRDGLYTQNPGY